MWGPRLIFSCGPPLPLPSPSSSALPIFHSYLPAVWSGGMSVPAAPSSPNNPPSCLLFVMMTFLHPQPFLAPHYLCIKILPPDLAFRTLHHSPQLVPFTLTHLSHSHPSLRLKDVSWCQSWDFFFFFPPENVFVPLSSLKDVFAGYRFLG